MKTNNFPSIVIKNNSKSIDKPCLKMTINNKYEQHPKLPLDLGPTVKKVTLDSVHSINSIAQWDMPPFERPKAPSTLLTNNRMRK
jgi:hypothetical protein